VIGRHTPTTARQRQLAAFILEFGESKGYPPTLREMGAHLGIRSTNAVTDLLNRLECRGWIERPGRIEGGRVCARAITLTAAALESLRPPAPANQADNSAAFASLDADAIFKLCVELSKGVVSAISVAGTVYRVRT
jgi:SOS-response transcriptional repressor LexA